MNVPDGPGVIFDKIIEAQRRSTILYGLEDTDRRYILSLTVPICPARSSFLLRPHVEENRDKEKG